MATEVFNDDADIFYTFFVMYRMMVFAYNDQ